MTVDEAPRVPPFRITLFYGPEPVEGRQRVQSCVFNVKKRSWKAGVQVAVELEEAQLSRARATLRFDDWLAGLLTVVPEVEREVYKHRGAELLVQNVAALKLDLAIEASGSWMNELDQRILERADHIKSCIVAELDLPTSSS
jgi:hypothetical protein